MSNRVHKIGPEYHDKVRTNHKINEIIYLMNKHSVGGFKDLNTLSNLKESSLTLEELSKPSVVQDFTKRSVIEQTCSSLDELSTHNPINEEEETKEMKIVERLVTSSH